MPDPRVRTEFAGAAAFLFIDNPPVNALSSGLPRALAEAVKAAATHVSARFLVLSGTGRTFVAGADIREFARLRDEQFADLEFNAAFNEVEDCPKPVIAAIHGSALGGGLELAMACHYRVALSSAQLGQPEVNLGLIPGAGGTQRLPRLVGCRLAAEMCALGRTITAARAMDIGLVDAVAEQDLLALATQFGQQAAEHAPRRTRDRNDGHEWNEAMLLALREQIQRERPGETAPLRAVEAVEASVLTGSFADGLLREAELFHQCLGDEQSAAFIHLFFAERNVARPKQLESIVLPPRPWAFRLSGGSEQLQAGLARIDHVQLHESGMPLHLHESHGVVEVVADAGNLVAAAAGMAALKLAKRMAVLSIGEPMALRLAGRSEEQMIAEAHALLEHGIAPSMDEVDLLAVRAFGFPAWRGGPAWVQRKR
jgi:3-hydroxyacyl-CoA dehydrogenase